MFAERKYLRYQTLFTKLSERVIKKTLIRDLCIFAVFLLFYILWLMKTNTITNSFFMNQSLSSLTVTQDQSTSSGEGLWSRSFSDITTAADFWTWMENDFMENVFDESWYNGDAYDSNRTYNIALQNRLLWSIRLRQVRMQNNSCSLPEKTVKHMADSSQAYLYPCIDAYSASLQETTPWGPGNVWTYSDAITTNDEGKSKGLAHSTQYSGGGGYVVDLPLDYTTASSMVTFLKDNDWLDVQTRFLSVTFATYNLNVNLYCFVMLNLEWGASGDLWTSSEIRPVQLVTQDTTSVLVLTYIVYAFYCYYAIMLIADLIRRKVDRWSVLDAANIAIFAAQVLLRLNIQYDGSAYGAYRYTNLVETNHYTSIDNLSDTVILSNSLSALNVLVCAVKLFKYLRVNIKLAIVFYTIQEAAEDMIYFCVIIFIIICGYMLMGNIIFGAYVKEYRSLTVCISSLWNKILGNFDFEPIEEVSLGLATLFHISYMLLMATVLVNIFLAFVLDAYSRVLQRAENSEEKSVMTALSGVLTRVKNKWNTWRRARKEGAKYEHNLSEPPEPDPDRLLMAVVDWKLLYKNRHREFISSEDLKRMLPKNCSQRQLEDIISMVGKWYTPEMAERIRMYQLKKKRAKEQGLEEELDDDDIDPLDAASELEVRQSQVSTQMHTQVLKTSASLVARKHNEIVAKLTEKLATLQVLQKRYNTKMEKLEGAIQEIVRSRQKK
eukprot:GILK01004157.1.p1 GENE.GILK01004157.1~~GILK01004157.1.p1  ORF type:complete len:721 (+),score=95.98 GILK01004157.1:101-2263(+)